MDAAGRIEILAEAWITPVKSEPKEGDDPETFRNADAKRQRSLETLFGDGQLAARLAEMAVKDPDPEVRKWAKHARETVREKEHDK